MASLKADDLFPCLVLLSLLFSCSQAREFVVGGKGSSLKIPSSPDDYNKWAEKNRFQIGDYLVMEYDANKDSVLEVVEADFNNCNKSNPIKAFHDGKTKIQLDRSGPFYFISGAEGHCEQGEKLVVRVLSPRHGSRAEDSPAPVPQLVYYTPAPAPAPAPGPAANGGNVLKQEIVMSGIGVMVGSFVAFALL